MLNCWFCNIANDVSIVVNQEPEQKEELFEAIAVWGTNLSTAVMDRSAYLDEIHYKIGDRFKFAAGF